MAGAELDKAMERARQRKITTSGLKVRLVSREEIELRHEREDRQIELEEAADIDPKFAGLGTGDGGSDSRSLAGRG